MFGGPGRGSSRAELVLALLAVAVIGMLVMPLPTALIDLLIALNLGFSLLLLAAALYVREPLALAAFPTLLLLSTLYRLALNVASTRLILLQADAGQVIEAFGHFVVRGDYRVGALVFAMLTLVQFLVIARGAERVAEVGARFSLDALPGKQLAIDAELRAGSLRPEGARALRRKLERESQLYGALDGALKFVKGDAVAGLVIVIINFVGGVALGVYARDQALTDSLQTYGLLTIGDGLVTQLPGLLGATAAGLVVTRVSPERELSLAGQLAQALLGEPRALAAGALVLLCLALIPGLPSWPFLLVGGACALAALRARQPSRAELRLALGPTLHARVAGPLRVATLRHELARACADLHDQLGIVVPIPAIERVPELGAEVLQLHLRGLPEPARDARTREDVIRLFTASCRANAQAWVDLDGVERALAELELAQPALVRSTMTALSPALLTDVLRRLVSEGVGIRWLGDILDGVAPHVAEAAGSADPARLLTERARRALAPRISHALAPEGRLHLLRLTPALEEALGDGLDAGGRTLRLPPDLAQEIALAIEAAHVSAPSPHALITQATLRPHVRALIAERTPGLPVVTAHELMPHLSLSGQRSIGP